MRQIRHHRAWIAGLWLLCQSVALGAVPARFVGVHVNAMLASAGHDEHACCKGGRLCPMHKHQAHRHEVDGGDPASSASTPSKVPSNISEQTAPQGGCAMRAGCSSQPPSIMPLLLVPGVLPLVETVADALNPCDIVAVSTHVLARVTPPDLLPPR